jgi:hypothetical protein
MGERREYHITGPPCLGSARFPRCCVGDFLLGSNRVARQALQAAFRATGITAYLKNKGTLEHAQTLANHASPPRSSMMPSMVGARRAANVDIPTA